MSEGPAVIDASALLALIFGEPLSVPLEIFENGYISTVNLAEVLTKMGEVGVGAADAQADIEALGLNLVIVDFDADGAIGVADLRAGTRHLGLSLGDRACLWAARSRGLPVLTADRAWMKLKGFTILPAR